MIRMFAAAAVLLAAAPAAAEMVPALDLSKPERPQPGAGEAMVVMRFHASKMAGDNRVLFLAWDRAAGAPRADGSGFRASFSFSLFGGRRGEKVLRVAIVPAGDYVLAARVFNGQHTDSFCLGAPVFTAAPGQVLYLGDYEMFGLERFPDREYRNAMRYGADLEEARTALASHYSALAPALAAWQPVNGHRFPCSGTEFTAYAVPGAPALERGAGH